MLVVVGHVIAGLVGAGLASNYLPILESAGGFIYTFHMPAFLVLAGLFAPGSVAKPTAVLVVDKVTTLAYPYLVWSALQTSVMASLAGETNTKISWADLPRILYDPPMQFWFLYVLLIGFAAYWLVTRCRGGAGALLVVTLGASLILEFGPVSPTSVPGRCRDDLPYFALGALLRPRVRDFAAAPTWSLVTLTVTGFVANSAIASLGIGRPPVPVLWVTPLPGIIALFAASALLANNGLSAVSRLGRLSLEIYLVHVLAYAGTRIFLVRVLGVRSVPVHLVIGTLTGLGIPLCLAFVCQSMKFPYLFRWPVHTQSRGGVR